MEYRWHEASRSRCEKSRSIGVRIHETQRAEGISDLGPQSCRSDRNRPSKRDAWCAIRLLTSLPLTTLKIEYKPPPSCEMRNAKSAFEDRHRVTARGHLGVKERTAQRSEALGLSTEGITVFSRCQFNFISIPIPARSE